MPRLSGMAAAAGKFRGKPKPLGEVELQLLAAALMPNAAGESVLDLMDETGTFEVTDLGKCTLVEIPSPPPGETFIASGTQKSSGDPWWSGKVRINSGPLVTIFFNSEEEKNEYQDAIGCNAIVVGELYKSNRGGYNFANYRGLVVLGEDEAVEEAAI